MTRKFILSLAVAALAGTALTTVNADAMVMMHGGHGGHGTVVRIGRIGHPHIHWHRHFVRWHDRYIVRHVGLVTPVVETAVQPGPCTCLTKNYTPEGMVVFQDLCTKEMASAPVDGTADQASAAQAPTSYAGQTYQDYLKTHPDAVKPEIKKN
jgi:hypothetical protein